MKFPEARTQNTHGQNPGVEILIYQTTKRLIQTIQLSDYNAAWAE